MKLVTFRCRDAHDRLGALLDDGCLLDLTAAGRSTAFSSMRGFIDAGADAWSEAGALIHAADEAYVRSAGTWDLQAPLPRPAQFRDSMCFNLHIMQSFRAAAILRERAAGDDAAAARLIDLPLTLPEAYRLQPYWYKGNRFNVSAPGADIHWPAFSKLADFELELACVIGRQGRDLDPETALSHVFGYTIFNDFTARDIQALDMAGALGPAKGKDFDGANVFGPCIVTADEIGDPNQLRMTARVNGETWCDGHSSTMDWSFGQLISTISQGETLYPGEVIGSGTVGNGCGLEHLRFLGHNDVVELEIEKIGVLRNRVCMAQEGSV